MKHILTLMLYGCCITAIAQTPLQVNNITAYGNDYGDLFTRDLKSGFEVPKGTGKNTIFLQNIWIGGVSNQQLHLAAQTYAQSGRDLYYGPVAGNYKSANYANKYKKTWVISKSQIEAHQQNWNQPGYVAPQVIMNWPANGDAANGEAAQLAPYYDKNNNGLYEPMAGDYPLIRGDGAMYMISNDDSTHKDSGGERMKIEIHTMMYAYDAPNDSALNNTVFVNYKIYNRSSKNYSDVYFGCFTDFDLGSYDDDYVGCNPKKNYYFAYNGDDEDQGIIGYGSTPPAQGVMFLSHPLSRFMYFANSGSQSTGNPATPQHYYNYLRGLWKDGSPVTYGGDGYGGFEPCDFMYPGNNDLLNRPDWSEKTEANPPGDRRAIGSVGPFKLWTNGWLCIDMAFPFARPASGNADAALVLLESRAASISNFYNSKGYVCNFFSGTPENEVPQTKFNVYPNPARQQLRIDLDRPVTNGDVVLYNITGQKVMQERLEKEKNTIGISGLNPGIYFYQLQENGLAIGSGKLLVE